jgi:KDO2-lipid IV(A) lauroyltransferase
MLDETARVKRRRKRRRSRPPDVADHLVHAAVRAVALGLRALPVEFGAAAMGALWRVFGPLTPKHRRADENLRLAMPELDRRRRRQILREQWDNLGRTAAEALQVDRLLAEPARISLSISPALNEKLRRPGGQVHVSMHSGNWEICAFPVRRYRSCAGLYQRLTNRLVDRFIAGQRSHIFPGGLYPKGPGTARRIMEWVRGGEAIGLLVDHREARGVEITMFGLPALANPFPAMVARRLGVPLVAGRAVRLPGSRFRIDAAEIPVPVTNDVRADILAATQAIQDQFETWIRERPGEWMWIQDRWREARLAVDTGRQARRACKPPADGQSSAP